MCVLSLCLLHPPHLFELLLGQGRGMKPDTGAPELRPERKPAGASVGRSSSPPILVYFHRLLPPRRFLFVGRPLPPALPSLSPFSHGVAKTRGALYAVCPFMQFALRAHLPPFLQFALRASSPPFVQFALRASSVPFLPVALRAHLPLTN